MNMVETTKSKLQAGFTLTNLSVLLVIVGLFVGSILVGHDMIEAQAKPSQIAKIERFNTSVNTLREKYSVFPSGFFPGVNKTFNLYASSNVKVR